MAKKLTPAPLLVRGNVHKSGIFDGMRFDEYDRALALSASGCAGLLDRCPQFVWWNSPFNPDYLPKSSRKLDLGRAAHMALLQPKIFHANVLTIDAENYMTKDAKAQRERAYAEGRIPILDPELQQIVDMKNALERHPIAKSAFVDADGKFEQSIFWINPEFGVPCKCRPDFMAGNLVYIADPKTTDNASPDFMTRQVVQQRHHQRVAWYLDGIEATAGRRPEHYWFVSIERKPPHLISVWELDQRAIEWGRLQNRKAVSLFAHCLEKDQWPGYRDLAHPDRDIAFTLSLPAWAEYVMSDSHERGAYEAGKPSPMLLRLAEQWQSPEGLTQGGKP